MIRSATPDDLPAILRLIRALADYEREPHAVETTEAMLRDALFGSNPAVFAHVAVDGDAARVVGIAIWYVTFSTWTGRHGIWLEDLFVEPEHRQDGHGRALLAHLAGVCTRRGYARLEWAVLDWNELALGFYRAAGAHALDGWTIHRLEGPALETAARSRGD